MRKVDDEFNVTITPENATITQDGVHIETDYQTASLTYGVYSIVTFENGSFEFWKANQVLLVADLERLGQDLFRLHVVRNGVNYAADFTLTGTEFSLVSGGGDIAQMYQTLSQADLDAYQLMQEVLNTMVLMIDKSDLMAKSDGLTWGCGLAYGMQAISLVGLVVACTGTAGLGCVLAFGMHWGGIFSIANSCT